MTVNLMLLDAAAQDEGFINAWSDMCAIAPHARVTITDDLVREAAMLLDGAPLSTGESVQGYAWDPEDQMSSLVCDFGPSLLAPEKLAAMRELLAPFPDAVRLLDVVLKHEVRIRFSGSQMGVPAALCGGSTPAEEVDINMCEGNMIQLFRELGLSGFKRGDDVPFETFAAAVANPPMVLHRGIDRLDRMVARGRKLGTTAVYYA
jgi:hypothetical protein